MKLKQCAITLIIFLVTFLIAENLYAVVEANGFEDKPIIEEFSIEHNIKRYKECVKKEKYMYHAGGGVEIGSKPFVSKDISQNEIVIYNEDTTEYTYTNSIPIMEDAYKNGKRLFEIDINITKDDKLALVHGWRKKDYINRIGEEYYNEELANEDGEYIPTLEEFLLYSIQGKFKACAFSELVDFLKTREDVYIMVDVGNKDYDYTFKIYNLIVSETKDKDILHRFIVGGHSKDMLEAVRDTYDFSLFNLAYNYENFGEIDSFIKYCKNNGIQSFGLATGSDRGNLKELIDKSDMISYVFTENDEMQAEELFEMGVDIVGTDFLM